MKQHIPTVCTRVAFTCFYQSLLSSSGGFSQHTVEFRWSTVVSEQMGWSGVTAAAESVVEPPPTNSVEGFTARLRAPWSGFTVSGLGEKHFNSSLGSHVNLVKDQKIEDSFEVISVMHSVLFSTHLTIQSLESGITKAFYMFNSNQLIIHKFLKHYCNFMNSNWI